MRGDSRAAHEKGVLHRDLKPANIMLDGRAAGPAHRFWISAGLADQIEGAEIRNGTPAYMALRNSSPARR